jgi:hypothetical protein
MKADYLVLKNGQKVRFEWNVNSLGAFTKDTGIEMTDMANGRADIFTLRKLAWYMAVEGEEIEGRTFDISEVELGRLMTQGNLIEFVQIFKEQANTSEQKKSPAMKRFPRVLFRKKGLT